MDIGSTLREARMRARIDIGEVETRTKIRAKYLRAIENEEWDLLPGPVYVKSFLRTYGEFLGLDSRLLVDEFRRRYERPSDHDTRPLSSLSRDRERMRREPRGPVLPPWALVVIVLVVVVVALYVIGNLGKSSNQTKGSGASHVATRHHAQAPTVTTHTATTPAPPTNVKLQLVPTGQVWVCVVSGTGQKLINGVTYNTGQTIPTQTRDKLLVTLGNANVKMTVNGKPHPLPSSATAIGLRLTPKGVASLSPGPSCA